MHTRPSTPYRPHRPDANEWNGNQATRSSLTPTRRITHSASDLHKFKVFLTWKRNIPGITRENAILLSASGSKRNKKLLDLPLFLLLNVASYLCGPNKPGKPLEWLIISALFQSHYPKIRDQDSILIEEAEQKQILQTMFTTLFAKSPSQTSNPLAVKALSDEKWLLDAVIKESASLILASATRAAVALMEGDNEAQLSMVMLFGTYAQKTMTIYYLMSTLFNAYYECHAEYDAPGRKAQHLASYTTTARYLTFMKEYRTQEWVDALQNTSEKESFENQLKNRHSGYLWNAEKTLRDKAPPSPSHADSSSSFSNRKSEIHEPLLSNHQTKNDTKCCSCVLS